VSRLKRMIGYGLVGITGIPVDLAVVEAGHLLGVHYLLAIAVAYQVAMSWNFALQRRYVFNAAGNLIRQYIRYWIIDVIAFGVRAAVVWALVGLWNPWLALPYIPDPIGPAVPASVIGIAAAFVIGFGGTETVVFGESELPRANAPAQEAQYE